MMHGHLLALLPFLQIQRPKQHPLFHLLRAIGVGVEVAPAAQATMHSVVRRTLHRPRHLKQVKWQQMRILEGGRVVLSRLLLSRSH